MDAPETPATGSRGASGDRVRGRRPGDRVTDAATVRLAVVGMRCDDCAKQVRRALLRHDGVLDADVRLASASASITFDPGRTSARDLLEVVNRATGVCPPAYGPSPFRRGAGRPRLLGLRDRRK